MRMIALAGLAMLATAASANAHGAAKWIMDNPATHHCCGPTDCSMEMANDVAAEPTGWFVKSTGQHFKYNDPDIYPSIDAHFWTCRKHLSIEDVKDDFKEVKCLFVPTQS